MNKKFICRHCGRCCGPIPVTQKELDVIKKAVVELSSNEIKRLQNQERGKLTCILRDVEKQRCAVYEARPLLCRMYGKYLGLSCPNNPNATVWNDQAGRAKISAETKGQPIVGILSETIGWEELGVRV